MTTAPHGALRPGAITSKVRLCWLCRIVSCCCCRLGWHQGSHHGGALRPAGCWRGPAHSPGHFHPLQLLTWAACLVPSRPVQDVERYKAAFSRPGSLAGAMSYYKASIAANTKWWDETAEK